MCSYVSFLGLIVVETTTAQTNVESNRKRLLAKSSCKTMVNPRSNQPPTPNPTCKAHRLFAHTQEGLNLLLLICNRSLVAPQIGRCLEHRLVGYAQQGAVRSSHAVCACYLLGPHPPTQRNAAQKGPAINRTITLPNPGRCV